jgi:hypothetical protein
MTPGQNTDQNMADDILLADNDFPDFGFNIGRTVPKISHR